MKTKYISQSVAIKSAWMILEGLGYDRARNGDLEKTVAAVFESAPTSDVVEVRHGRWEQVGSIIPLYRCDQCHAFALGGNFCPNCGAKMDGKSADYAPAKPYDLLYEEGGPDA